MHNSLTHKSALVRNSTRRIHSRYKLRLNYIPTTDMQICKYFEKLEYVSVFRVPSPRVKVNERRAYQPRVTHLTREGASTQKLDRELHLQSSQGIQTRRTAGPTLLCRPRLQHKQSHCTRSLTLTNICAARKDRLLSREAKRYTLASG